MNDGHGVAGVDGALKRVGAHHLGDVGDLRHVQERGHAGRGVFALGGRGKQDVAVGWGQGHHLGSDVFGQTVGQGRTIGVQHLGHPRDLGGGLCGGGGVVARHQHMHITPALQSRGDGVERGGLEARVVVFGNNKYGHDQITFATFFNLSTKLATSATLMPAPRWAGSVTFTVMSRGVTSTPKDSGVTVSSGFFLAFMMLGKVT